MSLHDSCMFCRIASGREDTRLLHNDDELVAFDDIAPAGRHHVLVVPRRHMSNVNVLTAADIDMVERMKQVGKSVLLDKVRSEDNSIQELTQGTYTIGFVRPPFNSVLHMHMHVFTLPVTTWWPRSLVFTGWFFRDADNVIEGLREGRTA